MGDNILIPDLKDRLFGVTSSELWFSSKGMLLSIFLLSIWQTIWQGYPIENQVIHIPILKSYLDPTLYPNDPLLETKYHFVTFFFFPIAYMYKLFGHLEIIWMVIHSLIRFAVFLTIFCLSLTLFKEEKVAIFSLVIMLTEPKILGSAVIQTSSLHGYFVLPVLLMAFCFFLRNQYLVAYALTGAMINFNSLPALYVFCMFGMYSIVNIRNMGIKNMSKQIGIFLAFALPAIVWNMALMEPVTDEWIRLLHVRSPHHSFPFSWDKKVYTDYLLTIAIGILSLRYTPDKEMHRKMLYGVLGICVICIIGVIFSEWVPVGIVLRSQLFRSTKFLTIIIYLYAANYLVKSWLAGRLVRRIVVILMSLALLLPEQYYQFLPLLLLADIILDQYEQSGKEWIFISVIFLITLRVFLPHNGIPKKIDLNPIIDLARFIVDNRLPLLLIISLPLASRIRCCRRPVRIACAIFLTIILSYTSVSMVIKLSSKGTGSDSWIDVQKWARENTDKTSVFLTPPYEKGFRVFSERSIVGEWKDGTQQYFHMGYSFEWWRRMKDVGGETKDYDKFTEQQLLYIARKYEARYIVVKASKKLKLPAEYENTGYIVYSQLETVANRIQ